MRIASVCRVLPTPADPTAGTFVFNRVKAMSRLAQVHAIQPVPYFPGIRPLPEWMKTASGATDGLEIERVPMLYVPGLLKAYDGRWLARSISSALRGLVHQRGIDLVDAHFGYPDGVGSCIAARRLDLPVFITVRGMEVDALRHKAIGPQLTSALRQAAGCICVSHSLRDVLASHGVSPEGVLVAPNAVDRSVFRPGNRLAARDQLQLSPDQRLIASIGHLVSGKRHDVLIRAMAQLHAAMPEARLVIIGAPAYDPHCPAALRRLTHELGLADVVQFAGRVHPARVPLWLQAADAFALATEREGCCNAVLEALACGLPVVTTPAGDNPYFVKDDINGRIVPIGDPAAMAEALSRVLGTSWDAEAISTSLPVAGWDSVARQVLSFFSRRLGRNSKDGL